MKVKAKGKGQYKGIMYLPGDVFHIDDKPIEKHTTDSNSKVISTQKVSPVASWMEEVKDDRRTEERDPSEHDQHIAEKKGWA